jgi:hypothetical protein
MGGAIFDQGQLALNGVTLTDNGAVGGSGHVAALDAYVQKVFSGALGSAGGGIGRDAYVNGRGGGFGGPAPGARGGRGGARDDGSRHAGGGGGFRAQDRSANGKSGGRGGGLGGFGTNGGDASEVGAASVPVGVASVVVAASPRCFALEDVPAGGVASAAAVRLARAVASAQAPESRGDGGGGGARMGGAVFSLFGTVVISAVTISHNLSSGGPSGTSLPSDRTAGEGLGGGVFNVDGSVSVTGSTITGNVTQRRAPAGGGIYSLAFGSSISAGRATTATLSVGSSTVSANTGAGGLDADLALDQINGRHANASMATITGMSTIGTSSTSGGAVVSP